MSIRILNEREILFLIIESKNQSTNLMRNFLKMLHKKWDEKFSPELKKKKKKNKYDDVTKQFSINRIDGSPDGEKVHEINETS